MVKVFKPKINQVYFINTFTLYLIKSGQGTIEVDFKNYGDWRNRMLYLSKGQYIKFLSDDFEVFSITFPNLETFKSHKFRVLFKHLISLGYIDLDQCQECQQILSGGVFAQESNHILDISEQQWYWQNPFQANAQQYQIIFDLKDVLDEHYGQHINAEQLVKLLRSSQDVEISKLVKQKLGLTVNRLLSHRRTLEGMRKSAFSNENMQQIAYQSGFKDPSYFNKVFKKHTGRTPGQFREGFDYAQRDQFVQDILELLRSFHKQHHQVDFYAQKMHMSVPNLSKKVKAQFHVTVGQLIRSQLVSSAQELLIQGKPIKEVAWDLGFSEPHHFSSFFKHYTGKTPSQFLS